MRTLSWRTDAIAAPFQEVSLERRPSSLRVAFSDFSLDQQLAGRSSATLKNYRSLLREIRTSDAPLSDFDATLCRQLMADRLHAGAELSSLRTLWGALSAFGAWCVSRGYLSDNPLRLIPLPRAREKPHRYLTFDELRRLFAAARRSRKKPGELVLVLLLLLEGLRANELCQLRWSDVRQDRIVVAFGKGGRVRAIPLRATVRELLQVQQFGQVSQVGELGQVGKIRHVRNVRNVRKVRQVRQVGRIFNFGPDALLGRLQRLGNRAGVPHVHPHLLRHTFASLQLLEGMDTETLRTLGGWASGSQMLERYTRSAREDAALARSRDFDLAAKLLACPDD